MQFEQEEEFGAKAANKRVKQLYNNRQDRQNSKTNNATKIDIYPLLPTRNFLMLLLLVIATYSDH